MVFTHYDLLLDPLVLTLASGEDSARQTLRTLQLYKEKFGFPNSNGLVQYLLRYASASIFERPILNNGPCMWLNNTDYESTNIQQKAFVSSTTLLGWDPGSGEFIKEYGYEDETTAPGNSAPKRPDKNPSIVMILSQYSRMCRTRRKRSYH